VVHALEQVLLLENEKTGLWQQALITWAFLVWGWPYW
jgi:hypothetical protein